MENTQENQQNANDALIESDEIVKRMADSLMPSMLMEVDIDLRQGKITEEEAKERRADIQKNVLKFVFKTADKTKETTKRKSENPTFAIKHINEGLRIVKENIDDVVKIIRFEDNPDLKLQAKYNMSKAQVEYILKREINEIEHINLDCTYNVLMKNAEVAARFTIDSVSAKLMDINTDLNKGNITEEEARERRSNVTRDVELAGIILSVPHKTSYTAGQKFRSDTVNEAVNLAAFALKSFLNNPLFNTPLFNELFDLQNNPEEALGFIDKITNLAKFVLTASFFSEEEK
ncbi:MAG: FHIPEP family type III secretion protein [Fibromonadaceae bacterium]|jgi:hypothetical protein|nr:FHIPEP family type III secretion protein [Fibromonadaceae bacterium]